MTSVVLIAEELAPAAIDVLAYDFDVRHVDGTDRAALLAALAGADAVIVRSATELCEGMNSGVYLLQDGLIHVAGHHNVSPEQLALAQTAFPTLPHRGIMSGRAILDRAVAAGR